eukprot:6061854-Pyramimonas_sp.AAC.1
MYGQVRCARRLHGASTGRECTTKRRGHMGSTKRGRREGLTERQRREGSAKRRGREATAKRRAKMTNQTCDICMGQTCVCTRGSLYPSCHRRLALYIRPAQTSATHSSLDTQDA